ncbi:hypothetical protein L1987_68343 [Smallanthus sonchifolius]|uniref:Uncharacterized protein n=1 Tax=Smallanthus sonchifolius TaxID=185202 RepID=A0ACB9B5C9_9ASTR|nr:hypothetical protein L1987_68343 [Smallanthus sonchifolius]
MDTQDTSPSVLLFFDKQRLIFKARERLSFTLGLIFSLSWTLHCVQQQLQQILCMKTSHVLWVVTFIHSTKIAENILLMRYWFQDTCSLLRRLSTLKDLQIGGTLAETEEPFIVTCVETFSVNYKFQYPYLCSHFHCHTWGWHPPFHQGS